MNDMRIRYALLVAALWGCENPTEPLHPSGLPRSTAQAVVGTWTLSAWNSKPTPALYETWYGNDAIPDSVTRISAGTITLHDNATYQRTTTWRIEQMDGSLQRSYVTSEQGSYTGSVNGGAVSLNLFGSVRLQIAVNGNAMSGKIVVGENPPIVLGDVWLYQK